MHCEIIGNHILAPLESVVNTFLYFIYYIDVNIIKVYKFARAYWYNMTDRRAAWECERIKGCACVRVPEGSH